MPTKVYKYGCRQTASATRSGRVRNIYIYICFFCGGRPQNQINMTNHAKTPLCHTNARTLCTNRQTKKKIPLWQPCTNGTLTHTQARHARIHGAVAAHNLMGPEKMGKGSPGDGGGCVGDLDSRWSTVLVPPTGQRTSLYMLACNLVTCYCISA